MKLQTLKSSLQSLKPAIGKMISGSGSWRDGLGQNSNARGYGSKWRAARSVFLQENPLCEMCAFIGRIEPATVVNHKIAHRGDDGLFWRRSNWQPLCKRHHDSDAQIKDHENGF